MRIINIHGYNGNCENTAYKSLKLICSDADEIISYKIDYDHTDPQTVLSIINHEVEASKGIDFIVGTSLGGFFAYCSGAIYHCPVILINPALQPFITILGISTTYRRDYVKQLYKLFGKFMTELPSPLLSLMIDSSDEIVDHSQTTNKMIHSRRQFITDTFGHEIRDVEYLKKCFIEIFEYYNENMKGILEQI